MGKSDTKALRATIHPLRALELEAAYAWRQHGRFTTSPVQPEPPLISGSTSLRSHHIRSPPPTTALACQAGQNDEPTRDSYLPEGKSVNTTTPTLGDPFRPH